MSHQTDAHKVVSFQKMPRRVALLAACLLLSPAHAATRHNNPPATQVAMTETLPEATPIGDRIVAFALAHQGQQVGDGECYDLADLALRHVGAKSAPAYGEITEDADYVWGRRIDMKDAQPGDIIQFRGFSVKTTVVGSQMLPDGRIATSQRWVTETRDHHTSIVERNLGNRLVVLEQNVEPGLVVQRTVVPVASMTVDGSPDDAPGAATTTYEVAGTAQAYRPEIAAREYADR